MKGAIVLTLFAILAVALANSQDDLPMYNKLCRYYGDDNFIPSLSNCAMFYKCTHGIAVPQDCPSGLVFSVGRRRCDYPEVVNCATFVRPPPAGFE